jgi:hypothetical protein
MKRVIAAVSLACLAALSAATLPAQDEGKPGATVIRISTDEVVAQFTFEKGPKLTVTSKPSPVKPGTYTVKSLSLFKKDEKGKTWELRSVSGGLDTLATLTIDPGQEKILLLGSKIAIRVTGQPGSSDSRLYISFIGKSSERYIPGVYLDGRRSPAPVITIKDAEGKVLGGGPITVSDSGLSSFNWKPPAGFKGAVTVDVKVQMGPFETVLAQSPMTVK